MTSHTGPRARNRVRDRDGRSSKMKRPQSHADATPARQAETRTLRWRDARAFVADSNLKGVPTRVPRGLHYFDLAAAVSRDGRRFLVSAQLVLDDVRYDVDWDEVLTKSES